MLPNIRQIFASFRSEEEERSYSRKAVSLSSYYPTGIYLLTAGKKFYNFLGFLASCVAFSFVAQKLSQNSRELVYIARANRLFNAIQQ